MTNTPFPTSPQDTVRVSPIESLPAVPPAHMTQSVGAATAGYVEHAPFGRDPITGEPYGENSKIVAGLLQMFLGAFGVGRFYMGSAWIGAGQVALTTAAWTSVVTFSDWATPVVFGSWAWAVGDGVFILTRRTRDKQGRLMRS